MVFSCVSHFLSQSMRLLVVFVIIRSLLFLSSPKALCSPLLRLGLVLGLSVGVLNAMCAM